MTNKADWDRLCGLCDSPIEVMLVGALAGHFIRAEPAFGLCTPEKMRDAEIRRVLLVFAQYPIGRFRADFLLVEGGRMPLVVECDGWAFHQGKPETHVKDFERDQAIRASGFETVHFDGSRLHTRMWDVLNVIENALAGKFRE